MATTSRYATSDRPNLMFDHESLTRNFFIRTGNPLFQEFLGKWSSATPPVEIDLGIAVKGASAAVLLQKWVEWASANRPLSGRPHQDLLCINDLGRRTAEFLLVAAANACALAAKLLLQKMAMHLYLHHPRHFWGSTAPW